MSWQSLQWWTVPSISSWSGLQIGDRFKTLSLTLEMPFKDTIENPDPVQGWSPGRTKSFGASILNPIVDTVPSLDG
jgi:murein tripeptide amidase MpaA